MAGADVAYTPDHVARALVEVLRPELTGARVWEPYAGGGAFCRALSGVAGITYATDCDPAAEGVGLADIGLTPWDVAKGWPWTAAGRGFPASTSPEVERELRPQWIVTNPPFSLLDAHLPVLFEAATEGVALLLVGQSLAPGKRDWLWDAAVPDEMLWIRERIAFCGPGRTGKDTDMRDYAWVIWRKRAGSWMGRGLLGRVSTETGRVWRGASRG
jgi:hypothetical protein